MQSKSNTSWAVAVAVACGEHTRCMLLFLPRATQCVPAALEATFRVLLLTHLLVQPG